MRELLRPASCVLRGGCFYLILLSCGFRNFRCIFAGAAQFMELYYRLKPKTKNPKKNIFQKKERKGKGKLIKTIRWNNLDFRKHFGNLYENCFLFCSGFIWNSCRMRIFILFSMFIFAVKAQITPYNALALKNCIKYALKLLSHRISHKIKY